MDQIRALAARLETLHQRTADTPLFNPVFQLSLEVSRDLEAGRLDLAAISHMVTALEQDGLAARAGRLHRLLAPIDRSENLRRARVGLGESLAEAQARWGAPSAHIVFTAHPTFLLNRAQAEAVARRAEAGPQGPLDPEEMSAEPDRITLDYEHEAALQALATAQEARALLIRDLLDAAATRWPQAWRQFRPMPFRFATWVGYDMDGRTDISWATCLRFRLAEKALRLRRYADRLAPLLPDMAAQLARAAAFADARAADFAQDLSDPDVLSIVANRFAQDDPDKLVRLDGVCAALDAAIAATPQDEVARELTALLCEMRLDGLGMGAVHFRINSAQLHNGVRRRIDPEGALDLGSQAALARMRDLLGDVRPLASNLAALAIEDSTAIRQLLIMAQILRHIDAQAPLRLLIAECEQPATVLAALYLAKLFGVADKVDVSPLFETESALEHGGRFLDAVLAEPHYQAYVRARGQLAIQTGFSDAGRFVGQIPAALAIERLQGRLCEAMVANGLTDVAALIFNTHGESMGRGAHPASFAERLDWPLSPWARGRFALAGINLLPEVSFQGGDGYLFFATEALALATLTRFIAVPQAGEDQDPFYRRTDLSLDFYRAIRRVQQQMLASTTYARAVTAFGLGFLRETGSRKSRRQSDIAADRTLSLRQIRAIPHNAILQQLGYPVNVLAGLGTAAQGNVEDLADLLRESPRGRHIVRLARAANALASIKSVAAYGELFNSAYWATRTYRGAEPHIAAPCLALAEYLAKDDRSGVFRRLASGLRVDALKLHALLAQIGDDLDIPDREQVRRTLGVLQALRLALMQHMFLRVVAMPAFSRANDVAREDVWEMVFSLRLEEAVSQLRRAFPITEAHIADFHVTEPTDYPDTTTTGYAAVHSDFIAPIEQAGDLMRRIGAVIAHHFGAHG
ncbi:MAG: phosphoenolpyruvate carboxylase [Chakrabartia sp.]